jgi:hypothetical protein
VPLGVSITVLNENLLPSIFPSWISMVRGSIWPNCMVMVPVSLLPSDFRSKVWRMVASWPPRFVVRSDTHLPSIWPATANPAARARTVKMVRQVFMEKLLHAQ